MFDQSFPILPINIDQARKRLAFSHKDQPLADDRFRVLMTVNQGRRETFDRFVIAADSVRQQVP